MREQWQRAGEEKMERLTAKLRRQAAEANRLGNQITHSLQRLGYDE